MPTVHAFHVVPALPESLNRLRTLAYNLRWSWDHETIEIFRRLDRDLWETSGHNPVLMLGTISQDRLRDIAADDAFLADIDRVHYSLETYLRASSTWYRRNGAADLPASTCIAYFSMEFGLTECLPIYSGGLGVLAGDHLKSSSDLALPLVGVGLLYQQGYFHQALNADGWQQERYPDNDFYNIPIQPVLNDKGEPIRISLDFPGRAVTVQIWQVQVGRLPLFLLDTNIDVNSADDQNITDQLYGGDRELRLKQELVLGIGGVRALDAMGIRPTACHMNEGHSAFLSLERERMLMRDTECDFATAREATAASNLFTTHTPVPAGFDHFPADLLDRYLGSYVQQMGITFDDLMALGRVNRYDQGEQFNMALLALRNAHHVNGVSQLHGKVTRRMVQSGYPGFPEDEVPVATVTNGIHTRSFVSKEMADLLDRYLGGRWSQDVSDSGVWSRIDDIPDEEIWRVRQRRRERMVQFARQRLASQIAQRNRSDVEIRKAREVLHADSLTLGFARRFATYKRASLLLRDPDRLIRLLTDERRPVQIVIAGKAHPRDDGGKELIRQILQFARRPEVRARIVFLEDYDLTVARVLVQGVDIWLNTPRRPMEASGTSGMKVLANGGLNVSIPDGWWAEGYDPRVGWSIGRGEEYADPEEQDRIEADTLYEILEKEVVPLFYDRSGGDLPRAWLSRIKNSMRTLCPVFNTHRMVSEYATRFYFPATRRYHLLTVDHLAEAKALVDWKRKVREEWTQVRVESVVTRTSEAEKNLKVGATVHVVAQVNIGGLSPSDVTVQAYHGPLDADHQVTRGAPLTLNLIASDAGRCQYEGDIPCQTTGLQGFAVRILPYHPNAVLPHELPLVTWE